ncbi:hypothetical protein IMCC3317_07200 [Kordia antarctica]|uniref:Uncharacterized protein n=1 Tax=Kordia antarctica TaxID=1218801 RepID=A0A7L4ZHI0_9FLAO|nr:hypothetical protein [Kordia antarctica]QHI35374.1 hypothetical protein IMCC3317_07200 [Kordia antarctica]
MKKRNLKSLNINKEKVSSLGKENILGGGFTSWSCHSDISICLCSGACPLPLRTNEGPCPGGTAGCWSHIP